MTAPPSHHRPPNPHRRRSSSSPSPTELARLRHTREWATIAAEAALTLLRQRQRQRRRQRPPPPPPPQPPTPRRIRGTTISDEALLWTLARRYNPISTHSSGLTPSLHLWASRGLQLRLGTIYWGLRHILHRHGLNFSACGVAPESVCGVILAHVQGTPVFADARSRWYGLDVPGGVEPAHEKRYLCVTFAPGAGAAVVLSAYPATQKRLYMERRRNRGLRNVGGEEASELGAERVNDRNDTKKTVVVVDESAGGALLAQPVAAIIDPSQRRFKIKRIWHRFSAFQIRRVFYTNAEVDALPGTTSERRVRRLSGKSVHVITTAETSPIIPSRAPAASPPRKFRIRRYPYPHSPSQEEPPATTSLQPPLQPSPPPPPPPPPPKPRVHRTLAPPYRPKPRITHFISQRKLVRSIRGRPFIRVDRGRTRSGGLRRPAVRRAPWVQRTQRAQRAQERWSVTRGTPTDVLGVLGALVKARRGGEPVDVRGVRAGALGLLGERRGGWVPERRAGAFAAVVRRGMGVGGQRGVKTWAVGPVRGLWAWVGRRLICR